MLDCVEAVGNYPTFRELTWADCHLGFRLPHGELFACKNIPDPFPFYLLELRQIHSRQRRPERRVKLIAILSFIFLQSFIESVIFLF